MQPRWDGLCRLHGLQQYPSPRHGSVNEHVDRGANHASTRRDYGWAGETGERELRGYFWFDDCR